MRPICINPGCNKFSVPIKGRVGQPGVRYRVYCGDCHISSYSGTALPNHVTSFKQNCCSNLTGRLGWACPTDHKLLPSLKGKFQIDHIDGDPHNNDPANLQELCLHCHQEKGMRAGDYNNTKKKETVINGKGLRIKRNTFADLFDTTT